MTIITAAPDYSDKDFDSVRLRLQNLIKSTFPEWTDFNVANFGNILLELFAFVVDVLGFYQDNQAAQSKISTVTQREALIGLVKLIGYTPATATAATADVTISIAAVVAGNVFFPKGTQILTEEITEPIAYQTNFDATILAGQTSTTVSCENSETREDVFTSTGLANQAFVLSATPYIDTTAILSAGDGVYTQVTDFLDSGPTDRHFTATVDQNDRATIRTGNGINGQVPVGNVAVEYKIGGGAAGRVEANKLKRVVGTYLSTTGVPVSPTANNASASSGGTDRDSIAQIKSKAPAGLRAMTRSVAREDFEINALRLPDVARALMLTSNEDGTIAENTGILFIIPVGVAGALPSQSLKDLVLAQVTTVYPCTLTFSPSVQNPVYRTIDVAATVYLKKGAVPATVKKAIEDNLKAFFQVQLTDGTPNPNVDFGANIKKADGTISGELAFSDVYNVVRDTVGVRKIDPAPFGFSINGAEIDIVLGTKEFPLLGSISLTNGDLGGPL